MKTIIILLTFALISIGAGLEDITYICDYSKIFNSVNFRFFSNFLYCENQSAHNTQNSDSENNIPPEKKLYHRVINYKYEICNLEAQSCDAFKLLSNSRPGLAFLLFPAGNFCKRIEEPSFVSQLEFLLNDVTLKYGSILIFLSIQPEFLGDDFPIRMENIEPNTLITKLKKIGKFSNVYKSFFHLGILSLFTTTIKTSDAQFEIKRGFILRFVLVGKILENLEVAFKVDNTSKVLIWLLVVIFTKLLEKFPLKYIKRYIRENVRLFDSNKYMNYLIIGLIIIGKDRFFLSLKNCMMGFLLLDVIILPVIIFVFNFLVCRFIISKSKFHTLQRFLSDEYIHLQLNGGKGKLKEKDSSLENTHDSFDFLFRDPNHIHIHRIDYSVCFNHLMKFDQIEDYKKFLKSEWKYNFIMKSKIFDKFFNEDDTQFSDKYKMIVRREGDFKINFFKFIKGSFRKVKSMTFEEILDFKVIEENIDVFLVQQPESITLICLKSLAIKNLLNITKTRSLCWFGDIRKLFISSKDREYFLLNLENFELLEISSDGLNLVLHSIQYLKENYFLAKNLEDPNKFICYKVNEALQIERVFDIGGISKKYSLMKLGREIWIFHNYNGFTLDLEKTQITLRKKFKRYQSRYCVLYLPKKREIIWIDDHEIDVMDL